MPKMKTSIGGQAIMEGIMMRGPHKTAIAVRKPDKEIEMKVTENSSLVKKLKLHKIPILRGIVAFLENMIIGTRALMYSAEFFELEDEEAEPSKFEKWLDKVFGEKLKDYVIYFSVLVSMVFAVGLFIVLPNFVVGLFGDLITDQLKTVIVSVTKILLFVGYVLLVSRMEDIKRVFMYHGAEHKTIHCFESGEELTLENVKSHTRLHPRCGTSFLLIVMVISIIVFSFIGWDNPFLRILLILLLLPIVAGISYEIIKFAGRHDNKCTRIISAPGLAFQHLTTKEPTDDMIEVAIAAIKEVIPENTEEAKW